MIVYKEAGAKLSEAVKKGYRAGSKLLETKSKGKSVKVKFDENLFQINYTDADKLLLKNFEIEAFTVAGVLNYECEEKLKKLAADLIKNEVGDIQKIWKNEAYLILAQYIQLEDFPPPSQLETNLRTAVNSSYHAAEWQKVQNLKDVYQYMRYKTQNDSLVRDEHKALHNKIFNINDSVWDIINPPNGWNCRCYTEPLTAEEIAEVNPESIIQIADEEQRKEIIKAASVHKDFARNSGKTGSIWGKWLKTKLEGKVYEEITERMRNSVSKLPEPEDVIKVLNKNTEPFRTVEYNKGNWDKEFPNNKVLTPLGEFNFGDDQFEKLGRRERGNTFGLLKPTITNPEFILIDNDYGTLFLKGFKNGKEVLFSSVLKDIEGNVIFVSSHQKSENNIKNKVKEGKFLIYSKRQQGAGTPADGKKLPDFPGSFNFSEQNLIKNIKRFNEVWGKFVRPGKTEATGIKYGINGFTFVTEKSTGFDTYDNINLYRKGILIINAVRHGDAIINAIGMTMPL